MGVHAVFPHVRYGDMPARAPSCKDWAVFLVPTRKSWFAIPVSRVMAGSKMSTLGIYGRSLRPPADPVVAALHVVASFDYCSAPWQPATQRPGNSRATSIVGGRYV
jgi:hypothetical protein